MPSADLECLLASLLCLEIEVSFVCLFFLVGQDKATGRHGRLKCSAPAFSTPNFNSKPAWRKTLSLFGMSLAVKQSNQIVFGIYASICEKS